MAWQISGRARVVRHYQPVQRYRHRQSLLAPINHFVNARALGAWRGIRT